MIALIGEFRHPGANDARHGGSVDASVDGVQLIIERCTIEHAETYVRVKEPHLVGFNLDPIAARNLAALLVRASEEVERMRKSRSEERSEHG